MNNTDFLSHPLSRQEKLCGTAWLLFEALLFSNILQSLNRLLPTPFPQTVINFLFFLVNFVVIVFFLRKYLLAQLRLSLDILSNIFLSAMVGFIAYWILNFMVTGLIFALDPDFSSVNDNAISALAAENFPIMFIGIVFLVPLAEESLFRGVVFRGLYDRNPILAWVISVVLFALVHILGYIGSVSPLRLLLCFVQYIPAGICLAAAYRLSGSVLSPILIHAAVNFVGMMALR